MVDGDTAFEWGDAIAIVKQVIEQVITAGPGAAPVDIPSIESIRLDASGTLHAQLEPGGSRPLTAALGDLLHQLSASIERPPALRLFTMRAISAAPPLSLEEFTMEVAEWAPPDCKERLIKLYQRARARERSPIHGQPQQVSMFSRLQLVAASALLIVGVAAVYGAFKVVKGFGARPSQEPTQEQLSPQKALADITPVPQTPPLQVVPIEKQGPQDIVLLPETKVDSAPKDLTHPNVTPPETPRTDPSSRELSRTGQLGDARSERLARVKPAPSPAAPRPAEAVAKPAAPASSTAAALKPAAPAPSPSAAVKPVPAPVPPSVREMPKPSSAGGKAAVEEFQRARVLFERHSYAAAADGFQRVIEMIGHEEAGASDLRFVAGEYLALSRASLASLQSRVYTHGDPGVTEPIALGQFLPPPPDPGLRPNRLAVLEVSIDARGFVETAKLQGDGSQYRIGWWVSAAKAWRFQPAMKDGNPVRFLKRIVVADSNPLEPR